MQTPFVHPRFLSIVAIAVGLAISGPVWAQDSGNEEPGFGGESPIVPPQKVEFDNSERFVPPADLPIVDVYVKEAEAVSPEEAREELTAVSVTPEGEVELVPPDDAAVKALMNVVSEFAARSASETESEAGDIGANEPEGAFGEKSVNAESVIGADTRVQVTNTTAYPFRTIGRIGIGCTGTLIGPRHVLTAGHCVYNISNDKWYSNLNFTPGQNGATKPWGTIGWKRALSVKGWTKSHKRDFDYAMIVLSQDIGNTVGWLGYGWKQPLPYYNININGYPADKPSGTMWHSYCTLQIITTYRLYYPCDTYGGNSGSAVYVYFQSGNKRTIYGIHAYGVDGTGLNGATRIREAVFDNLKKWKATY